MDKDRVNETLQTATQKLCAGQVWEWTLRDELYYDYHGVYFLLQKPHDSIGFFSETYAEQVDGAWEAVNLETGKLDLIMPFFTAGLWDRLD